MLFAVTGLHGCPVEAGDGHVGSVKDFLFDDQSWKVRWMVVDTGDWLPGRQVLIHPSAIAPLDLGLPVKRVLPMMSMGDALVVSVRLTRQQIEASPEAREDEPVTKQMETDLYDHYGWDPSWGTTNFGASAIAAPLIRAAGFFAGRSPTCGGDREPSRRRRSASPKRRVGQRLSRPRNGRRPRPCGEFPGRRRHMGHSLSRRRHAELVAGQACPAGAICGEGDRLARTSYQCQCHSRSGEIKPGLGPPGHGGPSRRATIAPPFRLARLRLVVRIGDGEAGFIVHEIVGEAGRTTTVVPTRLRITPPPISAAAQVIIEWRGIGHAVQYRLPWSQQRHPAAARP